MKHFLKSKDLIMPLPDIGCLVIENGKHLIYTKHDKKSWELSIEQFNDFLSELKLNKAWAVTNEFAVPIEKIEAVYKSDRDGKYYIKKHHKSFRHGTWFEDDKYIHISESAYNELLEILNSIENSETTMELM